MQGADKITKQRIKHMCVKSKALNKTIPQGALKKKLGFLADAYAIKGGGSRPPDAKECKFFSKNKKKNALNRIA